LIGGFLFFPFIVGKVLNYSYYFSPSTPPP